MFDKIKGIGDLAKSLPNAEQMDQLYNGIAKHIADMRSGMENLLANDKILHDGMTLLLSENRQLRLQVQKLHEEVCNATRGSSDNGEGLRGGTEGNGSDRIVPFSSGGNQGRIAGSSSN